MAERRVMLKVSGEQLGSEENNFDMDRAIRVCAVIERLRKEAYEVACVVGGGNVIRGQALYANGFRNRTLADHMGMLATVQNGLFLGEVLDQRGLVDPVVMSNIRVDSLVEPFSYRRAMKTLKAGRALIIAGGTGKPGFTTDTGVVVAASELHCETVVKTTKVDGVYDRDPARFHDARRFARIALTDALTNPEINVMDNAALAMANDHGLRIAVCLPDPDDVVAVLGGDTERGTLVEP